MVCHLTDYLNGSIVSDQLILHLLAPQPPLRQVFEQMRIHNLELSREDSAGVDVASVGFN